MIELKRENFDQTIQRGENLLIFFHQDNNAESILTKSSIENIDRMIGRNFQIYIVDFDSEPEICNACSVIQAPEIISIIGKKIFKRASGFLKSNEILSLLRR